LTQEKANNKIFQQEYSTKNIKTQSTNLRRTGNRQVVTKPKNWAYFF